MISKIIFLIALILVASWIVLFSFYSNSYLVHPIALVALLLFVISYFTRNRLN
jgi:hypothetical protein